MKKIKHIFRFLSLTSGKARDSFAVIFHVYTFLLSPVYVHIDNASFTAVLSVSATATLLLSHLPGDWSVPFPQRHWGIIFLNYKSHRVKAYKWVWNSTHQWLPQSWKGNMRLGERGKGNCHFFLTPKPLHHFNFFNINTNHVLLA